MAMELPTVKFPTRTFRARMDLMFWGFSSNRTWEAPTVSAPRCSSLSVLYVKCFIILLVPRQQSDRDRANQRHRKHHRQRCGITSDCFPQPGNAVRKPGLADRIRGEDDGHGASQRVHAKLLGGHQRDQH